MQLTDDQLDMVVSPSVMRQLGWCVKGSKAYLEAYGINFKDAMAGKITVRHLVEASKINPEGDGSFVMVINKVIGGA